MSRESERPGVKTAAAPPPPPRFYNEYLMSGEKAASAPEGRCVPAMWVGLGLAMRAKSGKSRIHHRSIRNPSRAVKRGREVVLACVASGSGVEEAINFTARFIMEPPSIIAAGYARARWPELRAIINSEKLLIAIMSSFTETAAVARARVLNYRLRLA